MRNELTVATEDLYFEGIIFGALNDTEKIEMSEMTFFLLIEDKIHKIPHNTDKEGVRQYTRKDIQEHVFAEVNFYGNQYTLPIEIREDGIINNSMNIVLSRRHFDIERLKHKNRLYNNSLIKLYKVQDGYDLEPTIKLIVK